MLQDHLRPNYILTLSEQRAIFSYQVRSNPLQYNNPGSGDLEFCVGQEHLQIFTYKPSFHINLCPADFAEALLLFLSSSIHVK